ncbi:hypothetical protein Q0F99_14430 [Rathayibacter oskolensis]|uniref:hypothetical protein n=1 Tax=Rathayibacter oskolensis TaxID=1891671 RepID=UPI00265DA650|nr:hypothetical protein [Rathayibacter oskolensis]WKK70918.1 hypothetical protein Q0F99_14430 [Rathayibacter oskolensis]
MKLYIGRLENPTEDRFRLLIGREGDFVEFGRDDRIGWDRIDDDENPGRWVYAVRDGADVTTGRIPPEEWEALFVHRESRARAAVSTQRFSTCMCDTRGISHGVCCD